MKAATSTLNPYAASYIPLSKRGAVGEFKEESKTRNDAVRGYQPNIYNTPFVDNLQTADTTKLKGHPVYGSYGSSSRHAYELAEKQIVDEEFDMEMSYLQMTFPGISHDSLSDVYLANNSDLETTVDMLNQLEQYSDSSEKLPDTLDIGDVSEPASSIEFASRKLVVATGEVGASSSGSSELALGSN